MTSRIARTLCVGIIAAALLAAACSNDDKGGGTDGAEQVDPNGVVRYGVDLAADGAFCFDVTKMGTTAPYRVSAVFDSLLRVRTDGTYEPGLAESADVVDAQTIVVHFRDGLKFSDGTPLDATAVKVNLERTKAANNARATQSAELAKITAVEVVDPLTARIRLNQPSAALFYPLLAQNETSLQSPAAIAAGGDLCRAPVGAGPFKVQTYDPTGTQITLVKNPEYYDAGNVRLAGVEMVAASPASQNQALLSGAIDLLQFAGTQQDSNAQAPIVVDTVSSAGNARLALCLTQKPFDDARVRQALNYAADKQAIADGIYGGAVEVAWGLWPSTHPWYDDTLVDVYPHDPDKARQLLRDAGYPDGFSFEAYAPTGGVQARAMEMLQAQFAAVGVKMAIGTSPNLSVDWFQLVKKPANYFQSPSARMRKVQNNYTSTGNGNPCHAPMPEVEALLNNYTRLPGNDPDVEATIARNMQDIIVRDKAYGIQTIFEPDSVAYDSSRIGGLEYRLNALSNRDPFWPALYVKG